MKAIFDWNLCPPEILCTIFNYLDTRALTSCMLVNRKWKDIAEHTIEHNKLWEDVVHNEMVNKGSTFVNKSSLDMRNIYRNYLLWHHVKKADIKHVNTFEIQAVKKMNVYKDKLILINDSHVMYYDIKSSTLIRAFKSSCLNFEENDYMIVEITKGNVDKVQSLSFYIKLNATDIETDRSCWHTLNNIKLYRLENKYCYAYNTRNILWGITRKYTQHDIEFIGRYYGSDYDPVTAIHENNERVYIVTKSGTVWYGERENIRFVKVYSLQIPNNVCHYNWTMFDNFSYVVAVSSNQKERVEVYYDCSSDVIRLECSQLTCALPHGEMMFLGYNDGRVEIRQPTRNKNIGGDSARFFNIQQFFDQLDDPTVVELNVCETKNSHTLFVGTKSHVLQLVLTYPEDLL